MKEFGGYFELDTYYRPMLHENAIKLNCGRNCFAYLIKSQNIKKVKIPFFMCDCVFETAKKYGVDVSLYKIDEQFLPIDPEIKDDEWLYVMNYYGQLLEKDIIRLKSKYKRIIVDNSQAFFDMPIENTDTLYTCRKYFGVADGAFLYTESLFNEILPVDESFERMRFVLGRYERTASEFYAESSDNNKQFKNEPIKQMSKLTNNLLHGIDYGFVRDRRTDNFKSYHEKLKKLNQLPLRCVEGAFSYPFLLDKGSEIRKILQMKKIYIPVLWPNVIECMPKNSLEYEYANNILPLPCDQRYNKTEIEFITEEVIKCIN